MNYKMVKFSFIFLVFSLMLHASDAYPKLFAKLGTPLYDATEVFIKLQKITTLKVPVDNYISKIKITKQIGIQAEATNDKDVKITYLKALRSLQKNHDNIVILSSREVMKSITNNDYQMFLNLIDISMDIYKDRDFLNENIMTYYAEHKQNGKSIILDTIITNEEGVKKIYFTYEKLDNHTTILSLKKTECLAQNNLWDSDTCLEVRYGRVKEDFGIEIIGSKKFTMQLTKALYLLKYKSFNNFLYVKKYIGRIRQKKISEINGMLAYANPPTWDADNVSVFYSLKWCASILVHEAHHSYLYNSYKKRHRVKKVPYHIWAEQKAELACNKKQIEAMKDIGSPQSTITYLQKRNGKHGDLDGDGKYNTKIDKALRSKNRMTLGISDNL